MEFAELSVNDAFARPMATGFATKPVADEIGHRNHLQVMAAAELLQLGNASPGGNLVDVVVNGKEAATTPSRRTRLPARRKHTKPVRAWLDT